MNCTSKRGMPVHRLLKYKSAAGIINAVKRPFVCHLYNINKCHENSKNSRYISKVPFSSKKYKFFKINILV